MALPEEMSDNLARVKRILGFFGNGADQKDVLDIGSGLCVFPGRMKENGWRCTVVDPDPCAVRHAENNVGISGISGDYSEVTIPERFSLVTFNRVLEHVRDPAMLLRKAKDNLSPGGILYIEVPDGESAIRDGADREEFFIEHHHIFSMASLAHLILNAGFTGLSIVRTIEPSSKYTLYAFLKQVR
jgi:2-polyprenyl-3-methyl-5-hydroxy-6-metoxy-1,4-benzoquinol methylase